MRCPAGALQPGFAKNKDSFVSDGPAQSALREWRTRLTDPVTLVIVAAVAALLTILGPFGTGERLGLAPRFVYWIVMVAGTFSVGLIVDEWLGRVLPTRWPLPLRIAASGGATGAAIIPVVTTLNYLAFRYVPSLGEWPALLGQVVAIAVIVTAIFQVLGARGAAAGIAPAPPRLLQRLSLDKRGALISLSAEDHYTRVRTAKGEEMVLIRLSDAMAEAEPVAGLRVHRSHWVALDGVTGAARRGDGAVLSMRDGGDIPVSRSHIQAVKDAGLLPRQG